MPFSLLDNITPSVFLEKIKYPKLILLLLTFVLAYIIFREWETLPWHDFLTAHKYLGAFLGGLFFVYGFTAAPATALLLLLGRENNAVLMGAVAGVGALAGDLIIFRFIQHSFADEIEKIWTWRLWLYFAPLTNHVPHGLRRYLLMVFAGFIIASPLPDEIGVSLIAASRGISIETFAIASYLLNTAGIFVVLFIGANL